MNTSSQFQFTFKTKSEQAEGEFKDQKEKMISDMKFQIESI